MNDDLIICPSCSKELDERELMTKSQTIESCPVCKTVVRESDSFSSTNLAVLIVDSVAAIDTWLADYSKETSFRVLTRDATDRKLRWVVETPHGVAVECHYCESTPRFVEIRALTKSNANLVLGQLNSLALIAGKHGLQPFCERQTNQGSSEHTDACWGMVQYLNVNVLGAQLLCAITDRLANAVKKAIEDFSEPS